MNPTLRFSQMPGWKLGTLRFGAHALLFTIVTAAAPVVSPLGIASATPPMTPSGLNTQISGPHTVGGKIQYDITGGTRPGNGTNLFHSFGDFGIPLNNIANFQNGAGLPTSNILGRVTGGNLSNIHGSIQTTDFGNANLFLMNPAGFLFGPDASVNISGMMTFTTADYLRLSNEDGTNTGIFYANPSSPSLLNASPVAAFGFLGSNPGAITVQGGQFVGAGISLIGGNITIAPSTRTDGTVQRATLSAPNGKIQLASTASPGEFAQFDGELQRSTNVNGTSFTSFGSVTLAPNSTVNISGTDTVSIRGGQFVMNVRDAVLSTAEHPGVVGTIALNTSSTILTESSGTEPGASVQIASEKSIALLGNSSITTRVDAGNGGLVTLTAPSIELQERSNIGTSTKGIGNAANVEFQGNQLNLTSESFITTSTQSPGHGGDIMIRGITGDGSRANVITLSEHSELRTETLGDGLTTQGTAGNIRIETARLNLSGASRLNTSSRGSTGDAGNIFVDATDSLIITSDSKLFSTSTEFSFGKAGLISLSAPSIVIGSGGSIATNTGLTGDAGSITVHTNNLRLLSGGHITSSSLTEFPEIPATGAAGNVLIKGLANTAQSILISGLGSGISTDTTGQGHGGDIVLNAADVTIRDRGTLTAQSSGLHETAIGGTITVNANQVQIRSGSSITANSAGVADAGNINITATNGLSMQNSTLTTQVISNSTSSNATGGNIKITTSPTATVNIQSSTISASVPGSSNGGNISIDPQVVILHDSKILAQTDQGTGGKITVTTNMFLSDTISTINADSGSGIDGTVTIQSPISQAGGRIQPLGNRPLQATPLLSAHCAAVAGGKFSTFMLAGRNSLPIQPGDWASSPFGLAMHSSGHQLAAWTEQHESSLASIPKDNQLIPSLRYIAPAGFLTQVFAMSMSPGCSS